MLAREFEMTDDIYEIDGSGECCGAAQDGCHDDGAVDGWEEAEDGDGEAREQAEFERACFDAELFAAH